MLREVIKHEVSEERLSLRRKDTIPQEIFYGNFSEKRLSRRSLDRSKLTPRKLFR